MEYDWYQIGFSCGVLAGLLVILIFIVCAWYSYLCSVANGEKHYFMENDKEPSDFGDMLFNTMSWSGGIIFFTIVVSALWPVSIIIAPFGFAYLVAKFISYRRSKRSKPLNLSKGK